jgi:hypothetical protein
MSNRKQQNRGFKPSPSGTIHVKINATSRCSHAMSCLIADRWVYT